MNWIRIFFTGLIVGLLGMVLLMRPDEPSLIGVGFRPIRSGSFDTEVVRAFLEKELLRVKAHSSSNEGVLELTAIAAWEYDQKGDPESLRIELLCACPEGFVHARGAAPGVSRIGWFSKHDETLATIAARAAVRDLARQLSRSRKKNQLLAPALHHPGAGPFFILLKKGPRARTGTGAAGFGRAYNSRHQPTSSLFCFSV